MQWIEDITIGLPFCVFKCVSGLLFHQYWLVALGVIDIFINVTNIFSFLFLRRRIFDACLLSYLVRLIKRPDPKVKSRWQDLGNSLDVVLSFSLVAIVIGGGFIKQIPASHLPIWNLSVVLNVLGAGLSRLTSSIKNLQL